MKKLNIDIETFSDVDIKKGVYRYVDSPQFEILLFAYSFDGGKKTCIDLTSGEKIPPAVLDALVDPSVEKWAYNAQFERVCIGKHLGVTLDPHEWRCTMVLANMLGLSGGLGGVANFLGLDEQKDAKGKALIKFFSVPCRPTKANGGRTRNLPEHDPEKWQFYIEYCIQDVEAEEEMGERLLSLPGIPAIEWDTYALDQIINDRGIEIDNDLVDGAVAIMEDMSESYRDELLQLTGLENPNSVAQLSGWLQEQGAHLPNMRAETVKQALEDDSLPIIAKKALELRQESSLSSVKKYVMMKDIECSDGRVHGLLQFYGANRTGRWAGRLVQVQNLPRNYMDDLDEARAFIKTKDFELLNMVYDSPGDTLKQLLRTALVAKKDHTFYVSDFSAIEARVIAWFAGEKWRLDVFEGHGKIYEASASQMFNIPIDQVDSELRQKGKVSELALGYQGGPGALEQMGALKMGIPKGELQGLVDAWRASSPNIVKFWADAEEAAFEALESRTTVKMGNYLKFTGHSGYLFITLPSGRRLAYPKASISKGKKFGNKVIQYYGQASAAYMVKMETYGGKLVENIVQATARDVLAEALLRLDDAGFPIVFHVHDEIVAEVPKDWGYSIDDMNELMGQSVEWAPGLPLRSDGYVTDYYKKD